MFCASIIHKALHCIVTCQCTRRPARLEKEGSKNCGPRCTSPHAGPVRLQRAYSALVGGQVEAREPCGVTAVFRPGQSGGGREGARPAGAAPVLAPPRYPRSQGGLRARGAGVSRFLARYGAADVTSRRRGGCGRVPGIPEVRPQLRGARAPGATPSPGPVKR